VQSGPNLLPYLPIFLLLIVGIGLSVAMVAVTRIMGPRLSTAIKRAPFESGSDPVGTARERFSVKFYMVALLFIVFDVEAVFIYPWAVLLQELGWAAMISMLIFMATLVVGLIYVWKKGALTWV
jgi:NADH-quinone oxidoreductase subunit A